MMAGAFSVIPEMCRQWENNRSHIQQLKTRVEGGGPARVKELEEECSRLVGLLKAKDELHSKARADWEAACARTNQMLEARARTANDYRAKAEDLARELEGRVTEIKKLEGELAGAEARVGALSHEKDQLVAANTELTGRVERLVDDRYWLISKGIPLAVEAVRGSDAFMQGVINMNARAEAVGRHEGAVAGHALGVAGQPLADCEYVNPDAPGELMAAQNSFDSMSFPVVDDLIAMAANDDLTELHAMLTLYEEEDGGDDAAMGGV